MNIDKLKRSIEGMPRPAYILLKCILIMCCAMLIVSMSLFIAVGTLSQSDPGLYHMAVLFLENPAGMLLAGGIGVAFILDRS